MSNEHNGTLANETAGVVARALDGVAEALRDTLPIPVSDLADRGRGNLFHGLKHVQDRVVAAQAERARVIERANELAQLDDLDMKFETGAIVGETTTTALDSAMDVVREVANRLRPEATR
jgi:hypothetical protein